MPGSTTGIRATGRHAIAFLAGDLPRLFRKRHADFPQQAALQPDAQEESRWRGALAELGPGPYIGLSWRGERLRGQRTGRCPPLRAWADFLGRIEGTLICLQADATAEEIAALEEVSGQAIVRTPDLDQARELDRLAALASALDCVVSVPNSTAQLAAAIGTRTLKLTYAGSWTGLGRDYEPLAPACRIIKPAKPGDWNDVFAQAEAALPR